MTRHHHNRPAFTLIELLVVVAIVALLMSILMPSLAAARDTARTVRCTGNLHGLATAASCYQQDYDGHFWKTVRYNHPTAGVHTYFWGTNTQPVDTAPSPLMRYVQHELGVFWCPNLRWGEYVPQGGVNEPTTTYGYNAWALDPGFWGRRDSNGSPLPMMRITDVTRPMDLFVLADSGMSWSPGGVSIFQNSTSLDPPKFAWGDNTTATTHFRHMNKTNALCVDGHAASFELEGGRFTHEEQMLGFVGEQNSPHYDQ
ncbi:prepilin-type N-terminal cleavage/methylation domain-containing protein [Planctomycetales bacterium ZRK34]|nr:prepilin-type N-terminal cleavage/methylation domain-containing protein [Planctomycetales bacterium ZRK34]